jgi:hypothetical protein
MLRALPNTDMPRPTTVTTTVAIPFVLPVIKDTDTLIPDPDYNTEYMVVRSAQSKRRNNLDLPLNLGKEEVMDIPAIRHYISRIHTIYNFHSDTLQITELDTTLTQLIMRLMPRVVVLGGYYN